MPIFEIRPLTKADIPYGMELKQIAGWNQTVQDWNLLLDACRGGCYTAVVNNIPVGTITTTSYPNDFSWLGMLLVHPEYRKQGIGTALLAAAIQYAKKIGPVRLDATPTGQPIYAKLGFAVEYHLDRMVRSPSSEALPKFHSLQKGSFQHLPQICHFDSPVFGADRREILFGFYDFAPQYSFVSMTQNHSGKDSEIRGFCLGRPGSRYDQIGPIVADNINIAANLIVAALHKSHERPIVVDVPRDNPSWLKQLERLGFIKVREYARMVLGATRIFGQPEKYFAIAGPEIG